MGAQTLARSGPELYSESPSKASTGETGYVSYSADLLWDHADTTLELTHSGVVVPRPADRRTRRAVGINDGLKKGVGGRVARRRCLLGRRHESYPARVAGRFNRYDEAVVLLGARVETLFLIGVVGRALRGTVEGDSRVMR